MAGQTVLDDVSAELRQEAVMRMLRKSFKRAAIFSVDFDAIGEELREMSRALSKLFRKQGLQLGDKISLSSAARARQRVQAYRDRATEIGSELREIQAKAYPLYNAGSVYIKQSPLVRRFSIGAVDDIIAVTLQEISGFIDRTDYLLEDVKSVLANLDAQTRTIDSWTWMHREFVFMSGSSIGSQSPLAGKHDRHRQAHNTDEDSSSSKTGLARFSRRNDD